MTRSEPSFVAVVKRDCPTCTLIVPVLRELEAQGVPLTVYAQDDLAFLDGVAGARDDRELEHSFRLGVQTVPTLIAMQGGREIGRAIGWIRAEWEQTTGIAHLGANLP